MWRFSWEGLKLLHRFVPLKTTGQLTVAAGDGLFVEGRNFPFTSKEVKAACEKSQTCAKIKPGFCCPDPLVLVKATTPLERLKAGLVHGTNEYLLVIVDKINCYPFVLPCAVYLPNLLWNIFLSFFLCGFPNMFLLTEQCPLWVSCSTITCVCSSLRWRRDNSVNIRSRPLSWFSERFSRCFSWHLASKYSNDDLATEQLPDTSGNFEPEGSTDPETLALKGWQSHCSSWATWKENHYHAGRTG